MFSMCIILNAKQYIILFDCAQSCHHPVVLPKQVILLQITIMWHLQTFISFIRPRSKSKRWIYDSCLCEWYKVIRVQWPTQYLTNKKLFQTLNCSKCHSVNVIWFATLNVNSSIYSSQTAVTRSCSVIILFLVIMSEFVL